MDLMLGAEEVRVLGALVEKELSTPDYYPMTRNALVAACNQKTNRDPVVSYDEATVEQVLDALQRKRLVGMASGASMRAAKYRHALAEVLGLDRPALAVLSSLMLRGAETVGEIRGRTGRMYEFESLEAVEAVLADLEAHDPPLAARLPRRPGQKEDRYLHRFAPLPEEAPEAYAGPGIVPPRDERLDALEEEVAALRDALADLQDAFERFRSQFE